MFPYDYKTSELAFYSFNLTTAFIDFFAWIGKLFAQKLGPLFHTIYKNLFCKFTGWAYNLKTVSADMIRKRVCRTGDGSHKFSKELNIKSDTEVIKEFVLQKSVDENGNMINGSDGLVWGFDDELMSEEDKNCIKVLKEHKDLKL